MPKTAMNYENCCIYKIEHINDESLVYVGHTNNFKQRKARHKHNCNCETGNSYNIKLYQMVRDNGGWDAFKMIEVEKYPCKDRREAERRENELMKELKSNMNTNRSFVTEDENKEEKKFYRKQYYNMNKEILLKKQKLYKKEYNENNKDKLKEQKKIWYERNKERIKAQK
jgi:hypothetical protein